MKINNILILLMLTLSLSSQARVFSIHDESKNGIRFYFSIPPKIQNMKQNVVKSGFNKTRYSIIPDIKGGVASLHIYDNLDQLLSHCLLKTGTLDLFVNYSENGLRPQKGKRGETSNPGKKYLLDHNIQRSDIICIPTK